MPGPLDGGRQFTLMPHAIAGNTSRDNPTALGQKVSQQSDIFKIDRPFFDTKPTRPATLKKPSAAATAVPISTLFTLHNRLPLCLDVLFRFVPGVIRRLSPAAAILALRHERHCLGHDFVLAALLAIFRFPPALLQPPVDDDPAPLA